MAAYLLPLRSQRLDRGCAGGRPSHLIFGEFRKGEVRRVPLLRGWLNSRRHYAGRGRRWTALLSSWLSEHGMVVRRALRHGLQYIPMFDDLAVFQAEEVRCGGAPVFRGGLQ